MSSDAVVLAVIAVREAYETADLTMMDPGLRGALDALCEVDLLDPGTPAARRRDPATSQQGAASVKMRAGSQRAKLLHAYSVAPESRGHGFTADEAAAWAQLPATSCYWKRCSELREAGLIVPTGETRQGRAADEQMVCRITDTGWAVLNDLLQREDA